MIEDKEVFQNLKKAILANRKSGVVEKSAGVISVTFSDLIYSVTAEKVEAINFTILDLNLVLNTDDSLLLMELESGELNFFEIEQGPMERTLREHLIWRLNVLKTFGI